VELRGVVTLPVLDWSGVVGSDVVWVCGGDVEADVFDWVDESVVILPVVLRGVLLARERVVEEFAVGLKLLVMLGIVFLSMMVVKPPVARKGV
jgi:hypothetical protein